MSLLLVIKKIYFLSWVLFFYHDNEKIYLSIKGVVANDAISSSVVFVGPGPPDPPKTQVLYAASTFTNEGPYRDRLAAVASLSLEKENLFQVAQKSIKSETAISIQRNYQSRYLVEYVQGFTAGNFSYFVTRQPESASVEANTPAYHSKLIRVCNGDPDYYSYTEVQLICEDSNTGESYPLIQDAYLGAIGFDLARALSVEPASRMLVTVFAKASGRPSDLWQKEPGRNSALCIYPIEKIEEIFLTNIRECANGDAMRGLAFIKKETKCQKTFFDSTSQMVVSELMFLFFHQIFFMKFE